MTARPHNPDLSDKTGIRAGFFQFLAGAVIVGGALWGSGYAVARFVQTVQADMTASVDKVSASVTIVGNSVTGLRDEVRTSIAGLREELRGTNTRIDAISVDRFYGRDVKDAFRLQGDKNPTLRQPTDEELTNIHRRNAEARTVEALPPHAQMSPSLRVMPADGYAGNETVMQGP